MKTLSKEGGQRSNRADALTLEEERRLLSCDEYSQRTASDHIRRIHYWVGLFGALRGDQHNNMTADMLDVTEPQKDMLYHGYHIGFNTEKNNNGGRKTKGENRQARIAYIPLDPSSGPNVTAVADLDLYLSMRSDRCSPKLYLQPDRKGKFAYTKQPIGKNMIAKFLQDGFNSIGIDYKRITNHSLRKTNATRLYAGGVEEQLIIESTCKLSKLLLLLYLILFCY